MTDTSPIGLDLEQQLDNVLSFITQPNRPPQGDAKADTPQSTVNKALYYLKNEQAPLAAKWMRLAAMSGDHRAQFYLGLFFIKGQGVPSSVFHGAVWLSLASSQDYAPATAALADLRKHLTTRRFKDAQCYAATLYEQIHQQQFAHLIPTTV
ncbi:MAG: tetratricopeptide repeat protein [Pseudoalteromonas prydzensis]|uniref:Sel1 repeat family protein n=2 Tax=root TaxID=1 RepID=A0A7V1D262_9GAMM|nr:sel1 repeat family protein [Pseudoalteromonas prydzensis]HEA18499.1 sel1 repeat family protein [Pseudoalteromonas prydzensis]